MAIASPQKSAGFGADDGPPNELEAVLRREERRWGVGSNLAEVPFLLVTSDGHVRGAKALEVSLHSEVEGADRPGRWQLQVNVGSAFAKITNDIVERLFFLTRELAQSSQTASTFEKLLFKD